MPATGVVAPARPFRSRGRRGLAAAALLCAAAWPGAAAAQIGESLLVPPLQPENYDRGYNLAVTEQVPEGYVPLGVRVRSFLFYPSLRAGIGATDNAFLTPANPTTAAFSLVAPSIRMTSDWSRHQIRARASAEARDYVDQPRRDERLWNANLFGRLDFAEHVQLLAEFDASQRLENQFTGEIAPTFAALSRYRRLFGNVQAIRQAGRTRFSASIDRADFTFLPIRLLTGATVDQANRDREITRATVQAEVAMTPSVAVFGQIGYSWIGYDIPLAPGIPNLDSSGYRALAGLNFDIREKMRGSVGIGYSRREYDAAGRYAPLSGISVEARLQLFPTRLTTVTVTARRTLEDSNLGGTAFFDNRAGVRLDHALLDNLIVGAGAEYARQTFLEQIDPADAYRLSLTSRYLVTRQLVLDAGMSYSRRVGNAQSLLTGFGELRAETSATFQI